MLQVNPRSRRTMRESLQVSKYCVEDTSIEALPKGVQHPTKSKAPGSLDAFPCWDVRSHSKCSASSRSFSGVVDIRGHSILMRTPNENVLKNSRRVFASTTQSSTGNAVERCVKDSELWATKEVQRKHETQIRLRRSCWHERRSSEVHYVTWWPLEHSD